jgi:hypothetical protein
MTCPFCGKSDDSTFYPTHLEKHKVEYLRDIAQHLSSLTVAVENLHYEIERMNKGAKE